CHSYLCAPRGWRHLNRAVTCGNSGEGVETLMVVSSKVRGLVLLGALLAGCTTTQPQLPVEEQPLGVDATAPKVRFSSQRLRQNFQLDQDSTQGVDLRLRSTDQVDLVAVGADPESGIHQVGLQGEIRVTCLVEQ